MLLRKFRLHGRCLQSWALRIGCGDRTTHGVRRRERAVRGRARMRAVTVAAFAIASAGVASGRGTGCGVREQREGTGSASAWRQWGRPHSGAERRHSLEAVLAELVKGGPELELEEAVAWYVARKGNCTRGGVGYEVGRSHAIRCAAQRADRGVTTAFRAHGLLWLQYA